MNKKYWILLFAVTVIAILPRAVEVFNPYNYFFGPEQGVEYLITKSIVLNHKAVLTAWQGGFGGFSKGPGFNYLLAIPFILANGDPFGGRIMMLIISVLTISLAFILTNRVLGLRTAALFSFLLAVSPALKTYAGAISPPFVIPLLTVIFIYFLFKVFQKKFKFLPALIFTVGLMTHFEMAAAGILLTLLIITSIVSLVKKTIPLRYYLLSLAGFLLTILPIIIFDIFNNFPNAKGVIKMFSAGKANASGHLISNFSALISNRIDVFNWTYISTFSPRPIVWILILLITIFGLILISRDEKIKSDTNLFILFLITIPAFTFLALVVYPGSSINQWWILYLSVIYCFLLGFVLDYFWSKGVFRILTILVLFILSFAFLNRTLFLYNTQFVLSANYIKEDIAVKHVFKDANGSPFGINIDSVRKPQENYDYLIWWNGERYNYQPYRTQRGMYYNIIEPYSSANKNNKIFRKGKLIKHIKLPNGWVIEKRLIN